MKLPNIPRVFRLLALFTIFDALLLAVRMERLDFDWTSLVNPWELRLERGTTFLFLAWNLVLAWIPFLISSQLTKFQRSKRWRIGAVLLMWLLFWPNAPYILTDLYHLYPRPGVPFWFDMMLILSFAWTGLLLGLFSLRQVHVFAALRWGRSRARALVVAVIALGSYGIFLGRFQRWNSWDAFTNPFALVRDVADTFLHPAADYPVGITFLLAGFIGCTYLLFTHLLTVEKQERSAK